MLIRRPSDRHVIIGGGLAVRSGGGGAAAYPLDGYTPVAAYAVRRLFTAYEGNLFTLRRDSDNAELAFAPLANGDAPVSDIATWLAGANGFFTLFNDQSGNANNLTQATAGSQPQYTASIIGGKPAAQFTNDILTFTANWHAGKLSLYMVFRDTAAGTTQWIIQHSLSTNFRYAINTQSGPRIALGVRRAGINFAGNDVVAFGSDADYLLSGISNDLDASQNVWLNGGAGDGSAPPTGGLSVPINQIGAQNISGANPFLGYLSELIIFQSAHDSTTREAVEDIIAPYYGISLP